MVFASKEMIAKAREMDLLTYLQNFEPENLVHISGSYYRTKDHDSLRIDHGKWYWFSRGFGGGNALDYLIKVREMSFPKAVETILGANSNRMPVHYHQEPEKHVKKEFQVPELNEMPRRSIRYLRSRGIHQDIVYECFDRRLIAETEQYNNVIFFGCDEKGVPRYASVRGTKGNFKGEVSGSDKHYAFQIPAEAESEHAHVFEAAIDLLSFASLEIYEGRNWKKDYLLSLGGVAKDAKDKLPAALSHFLVTHPKVKCFHLHLDNDEPGRLATEHIKASLGEHYEILDEPPKEGKDMNDELCARIGITKRKEVASHER